jgi:signal peptide peptidase SppA
MKISELIAKTPLKRLVDKSPLVAILPLYGVIAPGGGKLRGEQINLANHAEQIEAAFKTKGLTAVALPINSPGGSPVQSSLVFDRIRQLADEKEVPVYAFAEDVMASGGYWLGLCADEIYVNRNSVVGSIGVVSAGFGFPALMEKLGVDRRLYSAGDNKVKLDPFSPEKDEDITWLKSIQGDIHDSFKELVKTRRGERLKKRKDKELFSGDVWTGQKAVDLGLVDGIGDLRSFMREKYGEEVRFKRFEGRQGFLQRKLGLGSQSIGEDAVNALVAKVRDQAAWGRFGL